MNAKTRIYQLIDALLMWEGQFSASDISDILLLSRSTVQTAISNYRQQFPHYLTYCQSAKTNKVTDAFQAQYWQGSFRDYQQLLDNKMACHLTDLDAICSLHNPLHHKTLRVLNHACRKKLILEVDYGSLTHASDHQGRHIAPHSIVMDGLRAHVRAYCFKNAGYRDFIVGRFRSLPEIERVIAEEIGVQFDRQWNEKIELIICPDPSLSTQQKQNIEMEYQMQNGQRKVLTAIALLPYVMKRLRLDTRQQTPEAQQLIIDPLCYKQIKQYLPS